MTISSPDVTVLKTHFKCGGTITPEMASAKWSMPHHGNKIKRSDRLIEIGRCDRCGLAGIVCEPPS